MSEKHHQTKPGNPDTVTRVRSLNNTLKLNLVFQVYRKPLIRVRKTADYWFLENGRYRKLCPWSLKLEITGFSCTYLVHFSCILKTLSAYGFILIHVHIFFIFTCFTFPTVSTGHFQTDIFEIVFLLYWK